MALISRGAKANGTTSWEDGDTLFAGEINTDLDSIVTEINGQLDNTNLVASAGIDPTKVNDSSSDSTAFKTTADPGTTGAESLPTTITGELQRLRFMARALGLGTLTVHTDGSGTASTYWGDSGLRGPNLVNNAGFEVKSTGSTAAPDGWALVGTPTSVVQIATGTSNGLGMALRVVADAATEGISQTFTGLKASTTYFLQARYLVTTGSMIMKTAGADAGSSFRDCTQTKTSSSWTWVSCVVKTDSSATPLVVSFVSVANLDDFRIDDVTLQETGRQPVGIPNSIIVRDSSTNTGALATSEGVFPSGDQLIAAVTVPCPGCTISVTARLSASASALENITCILREALTTAGTNSDVDIASAYITTSNIESIGLGYTNTSPTVGETYTYSTRAIAFSTNGTANGSLNGKTHLSWLEVTLNVPS